ncbi:feather keratin-like [Nyctibius grandis]|uniref:feather keratin-like n=1 Tax=Nyctibius grandis TaxID=48427 RepID=UPI0035BC37CF
MACYDSCRPCGPTPLANSCNEPCVRTPPSDPAPSAAVGNDLSALGVPISSGGFGYGYGFGGLGCFNGGLRGCYPC